MNLSLEGVGSYSPPPSVEQSGGSEGLHKASANPQRRVHAGAGVLRRTPAVSPGSAEEEDMMSVYVPQVSLKMLACDFCLLNRYVIFNVCERQKNVIYVVMKTDDLYLVKDICHNGGASKS